MLVTVAELFYVDAMYCTWYFIVGYYSRLSRVHEVRHVKFHVYISFLTFWLHNLWLNKKVSWRVVGKESEKLKGEVTIKDVKKETLLISGLSEWAIKLNTFHENVPGKVNKSR